MSINTNILCCSKRSKYFLSNYYDVDDNDDAGNNRVDKEEEDNDYNKEEEDAKDKYVVWCIGAWVTRPERLKGAKDKAKMPEGEKAGPKPSYQ